MNIKFFTPKFVFPQISFRKHVYDLSEAKGMMKEMKNKFIRKIIVYMVSLLIVSGVVGGFLMVKNQKEEAKTQPIELQAAKPVMTQDEMEALYDRHKKDTDVENGLAEGETVEESESEESGDSLNVSSREAAGSDEVSNYDCPVDFEGMWETNKDVYAWITVPGTVIDYPILQHETDNTYYLNYNIDGSYGYPGCIYTENMNARDFQDNNTVIYGHNMKNGTMFAGLHKYEDASFFEANDKVYIYTPEKELSYTIFAAYVYDDRHLMYSFDFADSAVYANYLETIQDMRDMNANIREDITVTAEDKIITLVTCMANQPEKRLLVQAVLDVEEQLQENKN